MHVDEVLCHGENGGATCETSHQGCIMRKVISKAVTAGGRFDFFLDSAQSNTFFGIFDTSMLTYSFPDSLKDLKFFPVSKDREMSIGLNH